MPSSPTSPPDSPPKPVAARQAEAASEKLAPEDYYFDGPYLVFTTTYHLKRGYCCNSGCRHCPYGKSD